MGSAPRKSQLPYKHYELTDRIIHCFYTVYSTLGYGFLEKVYENALLIKLSRQGLQACPQQAISIWYADQIVGEYFADIIVQDLVILEIEASRTLIEENAAQLLNYLKATPYEVGLLLNFGPKPEHRRFSFENGRKEWWLKRNP